MFAIKENKKLLKHAQNVFGKDAVYAAYVCTNWYDTERVPVDKDFEYEINSIDLEYAKAIRYDATTILLRFSNGKEVMFTSGEYASMYTPGPKIEFVEA